MTTAYEQLKAMGETCIDNTPQQVESLVMLDSEDVKNMNDKIIKELCESLGCIPSYILKNVSNLMKTNKEYATELIKRVSPQDKEKQVESLCGVTESEYDKGMRDCVKTIASQIGLTFCVDVGYADLPYKLAEYLADLRVGGQVDADSGEWDGEGLPPVGVKCNFTPDNTCWGFNYIEDFTGEVLHYEGEQFVFMLKHKKYNLKEEAIIVSRTDKGEFSKHESPQEKAKREREENGKALFELKVSLTSISCVHWDDQAESSKESWRQFAELVALKDEHKE